MTEARLQTRTHVSLYLFGALAMLLLSVQNVRYGFYDLFYISLLFVPILLGGALYGWARRNSTKAQKGHLLILALLMLLAGSTVLDVDANAYHWSYMLGLFAYLLLPLRSAIYLSIATGLWIGISLIAATNFYTAIRFLTSFALLMGLATMYAYLYHHKTRSLGQLAIKDALTGAYNLRHLDFTLKQEISRSESSQHPLSLVALEIDWYAQLQEVHGNQVMHDLLAQLAKLLKTMTRAGDNIYYSHDGLFYLLLPFTHQEGSLVIAERIRRTVEEQTWPVIDKMTVCMGCTTRPQGLTDGQAMLDTALRVLRDAQSSGHNKVSHNNRR